MKSFFSRFQNKFSQSYGGRYIASIIEEISQNEEGVIKQLFPTVKKAGYLKSEYPFDVNGNRRIADLVLLSKEDGTPLAYAEVKYEDHKQEINAAQLKDYLKICSRGQLPFVYLTMYLPPKRDLALVLNATHSHMLYSDYAEKLRKVNCSELTNLFIEFIKDKGLMMEKISEEHIGKFLVRMFNPIRGQRIQSNIDMVKNIPENFSDLMTNINVVSQEMNKFIGSERQPTIDFYSRPYYKISKKIAKELFETAGQKKADFIPEELDKAGGELLASGKVSLATTNSSDYFTIEFGFKLIIEKGSANFATRLYVAIYGSGFSEIYIDKKVGNSNLSNKKKCVEHLKGLMSKCVSKALIVEEGMTAHREKSLKKILNRTAG